MGKKAGNIFGLGVHLGLGAYFAGANQTHNVNAALEYAGNNLDVLQNLGFALDSGNRVGEVQKHPTQTAVESLTGDIRDSVGRLGHGYMEVFEFGVGVGIAEGQASANNAAASSYAVQAMQAASMHEPGLVAAGYRFVPVTSDYKMIAGLRQEWQQMFTNSGVA